MAKMGQCIYTPLRKMVHGIGSRFAGCIGLDVRSPEAVSPYEMISAYIDGLVLFGKQTRQYWERPASRAIIDGDSVRMPKSLLQYMRRTEIEIAVDVDFDEIVGLCRRDGNTWITDSVVKLYKDLVKDKWVFTLGAFRDGNLVAGLWGLEVQGWLGIMSQFHTEPRAGSICFGELLKSIGPDKRIRVVDCGYINDHFRRHGAYEISREEFRRRLLLALK